MARFASIDTLRGLAVVWMTAFHFCFDLSHFGYWPQDFLGDSFWTIQRTVIVSLFLFCTGISQAIAWEQKQSWRHFWRRWVQVAAAALLVSAGSYLIFPESFIYFGVLHGIAIMQLLGRCTVCWGKWLWLAGSIALTLPWLAPPLLTGPWQDYAPYFNGRALNWLGWISTKPRTEDYVPLLPWLGVIWWGSAAGTWALEQHPTWLRWSITTPFSVLPLLGRWSLTYYLLHQPVLMGLLMLAGSMGLVI